MRELVVDASVAIKWLVQEEYSAEARLLLTYLSSVEGSASLILIAPDVILAEIGHAMRRLVNRGELLANTAEILYSYFVKNAPIALFNIYNDARYGTGEHLVLDAIRIGNQYSCSFYDALYVSLSLKRNAFFVTSDRKLYDKLLPIFQGQQMIWVSDIPQWLGISEEGQKAPPPIP